MKKQKSSSSKSKKVQYHHDDLRSALVSEGLKFIKSHSADDLSLRELARRLNVSHMAPYRHFPTKDDLLVAIVEDGFLRLTSMFDEIDISDKVDFKEVFSQYGKAYVQFFISNSDQARLMFSGLLCDPEKYESAHKAGQGAFGRLLTLIELGQKTGNISKKDNPYMLGLLIWSSVHGTAMLMLENQFSMIDNAPEIQIEKFMKFMSEKMLKGLK